MFAATDKATIEYAAHAGQAMLQYRDYKANQTDANQERAQTEVNHMFADQARVLWNSAVNIAEGAVNTALDAATTNGSANPLPLLNPSRPQVDFSSAKTDYRSEMMRRDLNGKLDGDGIKAGQFIETGVTVLAPIVVGAATTPRAAPESLKSLGALPEIQVTSNATKAVVDVRKFSEYVFTPKSDGKNVVFEKLGYAQKDSVKLAEIWQKQAGEKFAAGNYSLGIKDKWGQRINIEIKLEGIGEATGKASYMKSGWMLNNDGTISLNTPFSGFTK